MNFLNNRKQLYKCRKLVVAIALLLLSYSNTWSQLKLPSCFSDHMILQRDKKLKIWGWAKPGSRVSLVFRGQTFATSTAADSSWLMWLPPTPPGGPFTIELLNNNTSINLSDIFFGDVWFCSGQSNMNFRMSGIQNFKEELMDADYPLIRQLDVAKKGAEFPQNDIPSGKWAACSPATLANFSAVAFQFAKHIYKETKVPVGIIHASWGGSPVQTFMSRAALKEFPPEHELIQALKPDFIQQKQEQDEADRKRWEVNFYKATGFISVDKKLNRDTAFFNSADQWSDIQVPGFLEDQKIAPRKGISWLKKEFQLPATLLATDSCALNLGRINFACAVYVNGQYIGFRLNPYYDANFKMPAKFLKEGKNEVIVAVFNESGKTGFRPVSHPNLKTKQTSINLTGKWQFRPGTTFDSINALGKVTAVDFVNSYPTLAYNYIIHPLNKLAIKGFLWYQGEANANQSDCSRYANLLSSLIKSWREAHEDNSLPFLLVQLANYGEITRAPQATPWAVVQEAQAKVANTIPNTGFIVINDVGNPLDVHPANKQVPGKRLAALALEKVYRKKNIITQSPVFASMRIKDNAIELSFTNVNGGIAPSNGTDTLSAFAIAGDDGKFVRAHAVAYGTRVIVSAPEVIYPRYVRYAFESSAPVIDFYNKQGFPAVPFRTDKLPLFSNAMPVSGSPGIPQRAIHGN